MTQEEKARAYDEALEKAETYYDNAKFAGDYAAIARYENIFPELVKNENERIRKAIEGVLRVYEKTQGWMNGYDGYDMDTLVVHLHDAFACLEKQKEQKPFNVCEECPYYKDCPDYNEKKQEWSEDITRKAVKEVGLTQHQIDWFKTNVFPPKQEWSEEDEDFINMLILHFNYLINKGGDSVETYKSYIEKLKSLRPRLSDEEIRKIRSEEYTNGFNDAAFGGKLKKWSVEDEDRIRQIERIAHDAGCTQKLQEEIHDWLKSLREKFKED